MTPLEAFLLGVVQGLTEFLPISSSGHLVIVQTLLERFEQPGLFFDVVLHLGTLGAVLHYFRSDLVELVSFGKIRPSGGGVRELGSVSEVIQWIVVATVPTALIGLFFQHAIEQLFTTLRPTGAFLCVTGFLLYFSSLASRGRSHHRRLHYGVALCIGIAQGVAILPGISRSGATIAMGLFLGLKGLEAARFSFLISIPAILGAFVLHLPYLRSFDTNEMGVYLLGGVTAGVMGWCAIAWLLDWVRKGRFVLFAYYCWIVGGLVLLLA